MASVFRALAGTAPAATNVARVLIVLKYGGNAMTEQDDDPLLDEIAARSRIGDGIVLVHGGGPQIDIALSERHIETVRVEGLRVTDARTLAVTEAVLCGTVNKALVRELARRGVAAVGISGQDGSMLTARPATSASGASLGFVGEIPDVRPQLLQALLRAGMVPVVAPVGISHDARSALNINADTAAGSIAGALQADAFVIVTNVDRVRRISNDPTTGIPTLRASEARAYLADATFHGGMRPKISSALYALQRGARRVILCGSGSEALARALAGDGTTVVSD